MKLTEDFYLHEFTRSQLAARAGREVEPTEEQIANTKRLCVEALQPVRTRIQRVFHISSGIRPDWLNKLAKGVKTSYHLPGLAADTEVQGMSPGEFCRWIMRNYKDIGMIFDKVIDEFGAWTHVQAAKAGEKPRFEFWIARKVPMENGKMKTVYTLGEL